jgi:hypothetical protein
LHAAATTTASMQSLLQYRQLKRDTRRLVDSRQAGPGGLPEEIYPGITVSTTSSLHDDPEKMEELFIVGLEGTDDPTNPQNWSKGKKWIITSIILMTILLVSGASAIDAEIVPQASAYFDVTPEVALLGTALYMIALGLGTLIAAPFSETVGRNPVYIICTTLHSSSEPKC